jgi:hypothetical protein
MPAPVPVTAINIRDTRRHGSATMSSMRVGGRRRFLRWSGRTLWCSSSATARAGRLRPRRRQDPFQRSSMRARRGGGSQACFRPRRQRALRRSETLRGMTMHSTWSKQNRGGAMTISKLSKLVGIEDVGRKLSDLEQWTRAAAHAPGSRPRRKNGEGWGAIPRGRARRITACH